VKTLNLLAAVYGLKQLLNHPNESARLRSAPAGA
jgi:hypothetical protein